MYLNMHCDMNMMSMHSVCIGRILRVLVKPLLNEMVVRMIDQMGMESFWKMTKDVVNKK